ncbi:unnamed protein product, partial [Schistocephalus solidus]|uniref:Exocyst complex component Sec8 n=1 Tax=Schistocephalus solidus TaxID=70667 RepID=A0A183SID8_SCHSO
SSKDVRERKREQLAREYKETEEVVNVCLNDISTFFSLPYFFRKIRGGYQNPERLSRSFPKLGKWVFPNSDDGPNLAIRSAVRKVKKDIGECKNFLACNREELRRLWLDLIEQRRSLELIDIIDRVRLAPDIINNLISARAWPEATDFLLSIHKLAETEVRSVPALDGTMAELAVKKKVICWSNDRMNLKTSSFFLSLDFLFSSVVVDSDPVSGEITKVKHFSDLPLSDWRSLPVDPPAVNSNLQKDPRAVTAALLASTGAAKEQRKLATQPLYVQPRSKLYSDQLLTDEKKWADAIVALTHCLNRLQKLPQHLQSLPPFRFFAFQVFSSWRVKAHIGSTAAGTGPLGTSGLGSGSDSHPRKKTSSLFAPGQSLLTEIHNSIVLPAVAEIERNVAAQGQPFPLSSLAEPSYLTELLQLIFPALYMHFNAVMLMIRTMRTIKQVNWGACFHLALSFNLCIILMIFFVEQRTPEVSFEFLDLLNEEYVWEYIQDEVRSVLSAHLASSGTGYAGGPLSDARSKAAFDANQIDLNAAMGKRRSHNFFGSGSSSIASSGAGTNSEAGSAVGGISEAQQALSSDGEPSNTATSNTFFSFSKTSHSLSVNSYLRENRLNLPFDLPANHGLLNDGPGDVTDSSSGRLAVGERGNFPVGNYPLVCRPAYSNVRAVYSLVIDFTKTIEEQPISASRVLSHVLDNSTVSSLRNSRNSTSATSSTGSLAVGLKGALVALGAPKFVDKNLVIHCGLRTFLVDFIERVYLPEAQLDMRQHLVQILSGDDTPNDKSLEFLGVTEEVSCQFTVGTFICLQSVVLTNQLLNEVQQMTIALPDYAGNCSRIGATLLETFIDWTSRAYRSKSRLCGLCRKFPVWQRMAAAESYAAATSAQLANTGVDSINVNATTVLASKTGNMSSNTGTMAMDPVPAIVLGMPNLISSSSGIESSSGNLPDSHAANLLPFYGPDNQNPQNTGAGHDELVSFFYFSLPLVRFRILHERETTRLAVKEMDQLLHMIHDEVGSSSDISLCTANLPTIKKIGRLHESINWLLRCITSQNTWLQTLPTADAARFMNVTQELSSLSDACILMIYLDVRVKAFNLFGNLPRIVPFWCPVDEVDVDAPVTECLVYWEQLKDALIHTLSQCKMRFIFDGLGDFISQLFIRIIPQIPRINSNGNRKMCRNIYKLQQTLALLTENHESDLVRVKQLYELLYLTPEAIVNRIIEHGAAFNAAVYQNLLQLYQRSHPSHDHLRTEDCISKLSGIIHSHPI